MESSSESPSSDSGSNVCTRGSESDSSSRRRLRAASLPARDAGEGEGSGDGSRGDATAGTSSESASSSSIVAPWWRSSSVGSDVDGAGWGNDGGGLRQWPVDHAVFQGCRLIIRPSPFVGIFKFSNLWGAPLVPAPSAFGAARFAFVSAPPSPPRVSPPPGPPSSPTGATSSISIPLSSSKERGANSGVRLRARVEAHKTSIVRVTHPVRCRTKLGRDAPGGMPFGNSGGGRFGDRDGGGRGYGRGGRGGMTMLGRDKVRPRRGPVSSSTHACTLAPR